MNGTDIKVERIRRGLRQYRLAAALGIPQSTLCAIENGRKPISHDQALAIRNLIRELAAEAPGPIDNEHAA
jgi:transcriptional regulator with XRE-family HTH domain